MPRGFGDTIEKCADPNGLLRSGEDRGLRCRQVVRQKLEYCVRRKVEKPTGVYCESVCGSRRRMAPLRIGRRFADVRRARCDVDERYNLRVLSGLRNDRDSVVVADKDDRM